MQTEKQLAPNLTQISGYFCGIPFTELTEKMEKDKALRVADYFKEKHFVYAEAPNQKGDWFLVEIPNKHFKEFFFEKSSVSDVANGAQILSVPV